MRLSSRAGYTFVELMLTLAIFTFVMGGLYASLIAGGESYQTYDAASITQREVRKSLASMTKDLRMVDTITLTQSTGSLTFSFSPPDQGTITYSWTDSGNDATKLLRQDDNGTTLVAYNISGITVTDSTNAIDVSVTSTVNLDSGNSNTFQLATKVTKR